MNFYIIIPARIDSTRLPGKVLKKIGKFTMLEHCFFRAKKVINKKNIFVATCDKKIKDFCNNNEINFITTSINHKRALTRTAEAVEKIKEIKNKDIVIMYQADEPFLNPDNIRRVINYFKTNKKAEILNLLYETDNKKIIESPDNVKAIINYRKEIIYFSRFPIPYDVNKIRKKNNFLIQTGLIAIKKSQIKIFKQKKSTFLETAESVDMNRLVDKSVKINSIITKKFSFGIDTIQDLILAKKIMKQDKILKSYSLK